MSGAMCERCDVVLLALTAPERWAAARQGHSEHAQEYSSVLIMAAVLLALVLVLWWVSHRRGARAVGPPRESFLDAAMHRGLGPRERQILLAIVARSGLRRSHDIFTSPDAFARGSARLLAECAQGRTVRESERLKTEVESLRERIGYREMVTSTPKPASSRSIPVGADIELLRRRDHEGTAMGAIVVRNDDLEIAVEAPLPVDSTVGELWRVRYHLGGRVCQFDTFTVSCEDRRLVLNHGEQVHVGRHGARERVTVDAPAAIARFPFLYGAAGRPAGMSWESTQIQWLELVDAVVTEVAGQTLRIQSPLHVETGERILVAFRLTVAASPSDRTSDTSSRGHVVEHIGRVQHVQTAQGNAVMTVELVSLSDSEMDKLAHLVGACAEDDSGGASQSMIGARIMQGA